jgi:hypothetical protein
MVEIKCSKSWHATPDFLRFLELNLFPLVGDSHNKYNSIAAGFKINLGEGNSIHGNTK